METFLVQFLYQWDCKLPMISVSESPQRKRFKKAQNRETFLDNSNSDSAECNSSDFHQNPANHSLKLSLSNRSDEPLVIKCDPKKNNDSKEGKYSEMKKSLHSSKSKSKCKGKKINVKDPEDSVSPLPLKIKLTLKATNDENGDTSDTKASPKKKSKLKNTARKSMNDGLEKVPDELIIREAESAEPDLEELFVSRTVIGSDGIMKIVTGDLNLADSNGISEVLICLITVLFLLTAPGGIQIFRIISNRIIPCHLQVVLKMLRFT